VQVALAKAQDQVPGPLAMPGGSRYELKFDGFRMAAVGLPDGVQLWSKLGTDLTDRGPGGQGRRLPVRAGCPRWVKVKSRETTEVVIGAVIGTLTAPTAIVAGLYQQDGTLRMVGRSTSLTRAQSLAVAAVLTAVTEDHPWPDTMAATRFGSGRDRVVLTRVEPVVVVEVAADKARQRGVWRHSLRVIRLRSDLTVDDLPTIGEHVDSA